MLVEGGERGGEAKRARRRGCLLSGWCEESQVNADGRSIVLSAMIDDVWR